MTSTDSNSPIYYNGEFYHGVDTKRRVQIPAAWRAGALDLKFMLIPWPTGQWAEANLLVLPPVIMQKLAAKLSDMPMHDPTAASLRRILGGSSSAISLDSAGRICIPDDKAKAVGIDKEAVLVGLFDRFEIWNTERFKVVKGHDEALRQQAFKLL